MAYIEIAVSGRPKEPTPDGKRNKVRKTFPDTKDGRARRDAFLADVTEPVTKYNVRYPVNGRLATQTYTTKRDAEKRKVEVEAAEAMGFAVDPAGGRMTVEELSEKWLASNPGKRGATVGRDRSAMNRHIIPAIGQRELSTIRQPDIQALGECCFSGFRQKQ